MKSTEITGDRPINLYELDPLDPLANNMTGEELLRIFNTCRPRMTNDKRLGKLFIFGTCGNMEPGSFEDLWKETKD